jgi:dTDP-4-amino-4,6-dideoxygalactose transaminase
VNSVVTREMVVRDKTQDRPIVLMYPYVPESAIAAVSNVLRTRWIGQGPRVEEFERRFCDRFGRSAVAVGSGTDALHLAYVLAGLQPGDEVIAPLFTCTATNIPLLWMGAKIRFADVAPDSLNVDMEAVARMVNERTKAVIAVHYGGAAPRNWTKQRDLGVLVIEDVAQALGSDSVGFADYSCFSFQAVKHVTTGDGGMLLLPEEKRAEACRRRWFGIDREAKLRGIWANDISEVGYKYQMTDVGAAMGIAGLEELDRQIAYRRQLVACYCANLANVSGVRVLDADPQPKSVPGGDLDADYGAAWLMTVAVDNREGVRRKLAEHGIESDQVHYRNDRYAIFAEFRGDFPNMDAIEGKYLVLPLHMHMTVEDVERICAVIRSEC